MSKIGRKPIDIEKVSVEIKGLEVHVSTSKGAFDYALPEQFKARVDKESKELFIEVHKRSSDTNRLWGLHRALLANKIHGLAVGFEKKVEIIGLGYKAIVSGKKVQLALGYSNKIDFTLPDGVTLETDKSGQKLSFKSQDKDLLGHVCSKVRALRPPEPYKGTGVRYASEVVHRKVGKAKT